MHFQLDPLSPSGVSVLPEPQRVTARGGYAGSPDITRVLQPGTNVTFTGNGTQQSPYVVNSSGGSGTSPLTTKGDLYGFDTMNNRIPIGGDGTVLTADSTQSLGVKWGTAGSGSGIARSISVISTSMNAGSTASTDYVYLVSGTTTLTLPTAVSNNNRYSVTNIGSNTVTVATSSSQTINGSSTATLPIPNMSLDFVSDNTGWHVE